MEGSKSQCKLTNHYMKCILIFIVFTYQISSSQTTGYVLKRLDGTTDLPDSAISIGKISGLLAMMSNYSLNSHTHTFGSLTSKPTTLSGYGITDAVASTANQGGWTSLRVSGSDFTTTSTSLVDITGLVTGTLSTATLYEFECVLYVNSTTTAGVAVGVQQSGTGSGQIGVWSGSATNAAATGLAIGSNALNTSGAACVLVNGDGQITIKGFIKTGSTGTPTISMKIDKVTSGTAKVYIGSVLRYRVAQ